MLLQIYFQSCRTTYSYMTVTHCIAVNVKTKCADTFMLAAQS